MAASGSRPLRHHGEAPPPSYLSVVSLHIKHIYVTVCLKERYNQRGGLVSEESLL